MISNKNSETAQIKTDFNQLKKDFKAKEKDNHDLEKMKLNKQDSIKNLKEEIKQLKEDKSKLAKELRTSEKKLSKFEEREYSNNNNHSSADAKLFSTTSSKNVFLSTTLQPCIKPKSSTTDTETALSNCSKTLFESKKDTSETKVEANIPTFNPFVESFSTTAKVASVDAFNDTSEELKTSTALQTSSPCSPSRTPPGTPPTLSPESPTDSMRASESDYEKLKKIILDMTNKIVLKVPYD